jgi:hypothetical protein
MPQQEQPIIATRTSASRVTRRRRRLTIARSTPGRGAWPRSPGWRFVGFRGQGPYDANGPSTGSRAEG